MLVETLESAGLQPNDITRHLAVTRATASAWLNGHSQPHALHAAEVDRFLDAVRRAVEAGELPAPKDMPRLERRRRIDGVLLRHQRP